MIFGEQFGAMKGGALKLRVGRRMVWN